jgi:hypothetical protein
MKLRHWITMLVAAMLPASALAQQDRPAYLRALAAGYKASFLCSNLFNGGLSEAQTEADDLKGTYETLTPLFAKARGARGPAGTHGVGPL